ncbi:uncharacterized protein K02A2.6-like [Lytechinus pictus]|uniref:uncharacterized protein K02A2.6-like n=1 Tax=Lytechinus pictus TaxID=7653 RepID=UPI0030B9C55A
MDSGAECNVLPMSAAQRIGAKLKKPRNKLLTYSEERLSPVAQCEIMCEYKQKFYLLEFHVLDRNVVPVLRGDSCLEMNMIKRMDALESNLEPEMLSKYDVFDGLGRVEGEQHIHLRPEAQPVIHPPRRVPVALREKVKLELERMEKLGVIVKETQPTQWVNSMVVVAKKSGKVRICIDPKQLNDAIKREHYPMKTVEEVVAGMPNAKVFSTLDANCGYWQVKLDLETSKLCTFNTPYGRYRYTRMPFGVNAAPEIFQRKMNKMLEGLEGVEVIMDDILVWGATKKEHDKRLERVLQRVQERNLKLNASKC